MRDGHDSRTPALHLDIAGPQSPLALNGQRWAVVTDAVMGGVSQATLATERLDGVPALRLRGRVRLENNGGFVQIALDLASAGAVLDASAWTGLELCVRGNGESYGVHLRTTDLTAPWQSYRHGFTAGPGWTTLRLPFAAFRPHRTTTPLALTRLRRLGLVAIGRAFDADLALRHLALY